MQRGIYLRSRAAHQPQRRHLASQTRSFVRQSRLAERRLAEGEILDDDGNVVTAESLAVEKGESAEVTADESPLTQTVADAMIAENTLSETVSGEEKGGQSDEA